MVNVFAKAWKPDIVAREGLEHLRHRLGVIRRIHSGFDAELRTVGKGETIRIRRPQTFTATAEPSSVTDLNPDEILMTVDQHYGVRYPLTDKEASATGPDLANIVIQQHVVPAIDAIALKIEQDVMNLAFHVPWASTYTMSTATETVLPDIRKVLRDNKVPAASDTDMTFVTNTTMYARLLKQAALTQDQGAGAEGVTTQRTGMLPSKFGFSLLESTIVPAGVADGSPTTTDWVTNGAHSKGATSIATDATALSGTFQKGQIVTIDGERYALTAAVTAGSNAATLSISPSLRADVADGADVALVSTASGAYTADMAFHRNAFGFAMGRLPENMLMQVQGAYCVSVQDDQTGLALRWRVYYEPSVNRTVSAFDALWGVQALNPDMAVRGVAL